MDDELITETYLSKLENDLSNCMLERYFLTTTFVVIGSFAAIKKKNLRPFVSCVAIGTLLDIGYGYFYCCREEIHKYMTAKRKFDFQKSISKEIKK